MSVPLFSFLVALYKRHGVFQKEKNGTELVLSKDWVTVFYLAFIFKSHFKYLLSKINTLQSSVFCSKSVLSCIFGYLMEYRLKTYVVMYSQYLKCHCPLETSVVFTSGRLHSLFSPEVIGYKVGFNLVCNHRIIGMPQGQT